MEKMKEAAKNAEWKDASPHPSQSEKGSKD